MFIPMVGLLGCAGFRQSGGLRGGNGKRFFEVMDFLPRHGAYRFLGAAVSGKLSNAEVWGRHGMCPGQLVFPTDPVAVGPGSVPRSTSLRLRRWRCL